MLPKDPEILVSVINTKLRDCYSTLSELCDDLCEDEAEIKDALGEIGYAYDYDKNRFV